LTSGNNKDGRLHPVESKENSSKFIVAQKGDTYYRISQEFSMAMWELRQYNDFEAKKDVLEEGDIVYIQPKKRKAGNEKEYIVKKKMESLASVSQDLGIKLKVLKKKNPEFTSSELLSNGTKVRLK
jgi:hypothetical protein